MTRTFRAFGARAGHGALRTLVIAGAASLGAGLVVTACSASSSSNGSGGGTSNGPVAGPAAAGHQAAAGTPAFAGDNAGNGASGRVTGKLANLVVPDRSIIYTANLTLRIKKGSVTGKADQAANFVTTVGGYVSGEQQIIPPGKHQVPQVELTLKIPVAQYAPVLARLKELGTKISFSSHAVDVTQDVADVGSRVASAQAAIKQLRALLSHAGSVGQLLTVQETINRQESDLEALLAQQRALAHETSYATVTAVLVGHHARVVPKPKKTSPGFLAGLRGGWHALVTVVSWLLTALGSVLPFLIPVLLIGGIALEGRRRLARRKAPPASEPPATAAS
ncbi:MAG: DUF4349 domain-containing protein [Streptosporangiaceae bacterium]